MNESMQENIILKKQLEDKTLIEKLCTQLNIDFFKILHFNPKFESYAQTDKFMVYPCKDLGYNFDFDFSVYYPNTQELNKKYNLDPKLTIQETCKIGNMKKELTYVCIERVIVTPKRLGKGTLLINSFIKNIKKIESLQKIILISEDNESDLFWKSIGFRDYNIDDIENKTCYEICSKGMSYDLVNID